MDAFCWDQRFETGIGTVDGQHKHLVDLVNQTGDILLANEASEAALQQLFGELADYAIYHFNEEEGLMARSGVDPRHADAHKTQHVEFLKQVTLMWNNRAIAESPVAMLHGFLSSWLTVHILGQDQAMARIIERMNMGLGAAEAYDAEHAADDRRISPLLDALHRLYILLSVQNRELAEANANLEGKVTERTLALEEASRQLVQSEKLASLGRMVAGFAHEINTPVGIALSAISQNAETLGILNGMLAQEEVSEEDFVAQLESLQQADKLAVSNLRRAADLVQRFKRTSIDRSSGQVRAYKVSEVIVDTLSNLHGRFKNTAIDIEVQCPDDVTVVGEPGLLEQVLTNLMLNSLQHAFDEGQRAGNIRIEVSVESAGALILRYADDGVGMDKETADKAFEPFFTTARGKGGSGLGLYICYSIITTQMGGSISLNTGTDQGSRFAIRIPEQKHEEKQVQP